MFTMAEMLSERNVARFWSEVDKTGDCWLWSGPRNNEKNTDHSIGTFLVSAAGRRYTTTTAPRYSWLLHFGAVPKGHMVYNKCDVKTCVNPEHLYVAVCSHQMVVADSRGTQPKGEQNGRSVLTVDLVRAIQAELKSGATVKHIAGKLHVSRACVCRIKRGATWKCLDAGPAPDPFERWLELSAIVNQSEQPEDQPSPVLELTHANRS